jgi:hypothetical protein
LSALLQRRGGVCVNIVRNLPVLAADAYRLGSYMFSNRTSVRTVDASCRMYRCLADIPRERIRHRHYSQHCLRNRILPVVGSYRHTNLVFPRRKVLRIVDANCRKDLRHIAPGQHFFPADSVEPRVTKLIQR